MSEELNFEAYKQKVTEQGLAILDAMAFAATGNFEKQVDIPDGIDVLTDIAIGLTYLLDDFKQLLAEREKTAQELEKRVQERTAELEEALEEVRKSQQLYVRREWSTYAGRDSTPAANEENFVLSPDWLPATLDAADSLTPAAARLNGRQEPGIAVPIKLHDELIGVLGFQGENLDLEEEDLATVEALVEQVGLALENQRLIDQTRQALSEAETLYFASEGFNQAHSTADLLQVVAETVELANVHSVNYYDLESEQDGRYSWLELRAAWVNNPAAQEIPIGSRFQLANYRIYDDVLGENHRIVLVGDVAADPRSREDENFLAIMDVTQTASIALLPLSLGGRLVGLVTLQWREPRHFTDGDERLYTTLAAQLATSVDGLKLLEDAQHRAAELATLADIQNRLSTAVNADQILAAIAAGFPTAALGLHLIDQEDEDGQMATLHTAATWAEGRSQPLASLWVDESTPLDQGLPPLWLAQERELVAYPNLAKDKRLGKQGKTLSQESGFQALFALPLRSGGRRQAVLTLAWPDPHPLTQHEQAVLQPLMEPLGAIVASQRAQEAQRMTQLETEKLYNASRHINEMGGDLEQIIAILGSLSERSHVDRVLMLDLSENERDEIEAAEITVAWSNGSAPALEPVGTRHSLGRMKMYMPYLFTSEPLFFDDVTADSRLKPDTREWLAQKGIGLLAVLPLQVRSGQNAVILLQGEAAQPFSAAEKRMYTSLAPQIAVAVQNQRLLQAAQNRARREQLLREVTEKVRNAPTVETVLRTAAAEVGRIFGRKTLIYFNETSPGSPPPPPRSPKTTSDTVKTTPIKD